MYDVLTLQPVLGLYARRECGPHLPSRVFVSSCISKLSIEAKEKERQT